MAIATISKKSSNKFAWIRKEMSKITPKSIYLIVIVFSVMGIMVGYFILGALAIGPFRNVTYAMSNGDGIVVSWKTKFPSKSHVEYGTSTHYLNSKRSLKSLSTEHEVILKGLLPNKDHFFRVVAEDEYGKTYSSNFYKVE